MPCSLNSALISDEEVNATDEGLSRILGLTVGSNISLHFLGGALGGLLGAWMTSGQFKPVPQIIMELPPAEQQKLYKEVIGIVRSLDWIDVLQLTALIMQNADLKFLLARAVERFFIRQLGAEIKYGE
ncbi:hypothetical protein CIB84_012337 [Bambusicola thoracicus]|uniref:CS012 protein n=1 Tax=Bambusicola thoracicus TaxID=9083 RepID=A0A2P4SII2_BAMTH|nr:hypothetical protein CIB84_012337 [Bambusicola thoracicus]